jgi:hypothetical protein
MLKPRHLIGFTGHRQLDDAEAVRHALASELAALKQRIEERGGVMECYASAAYGTDILACEEAAKLGLPLHLILPKPVVLMPETGDVDHRAGFAADFWQDGVFLASEWARAYRLIQSAQNGEAGGTLRLVTGTQTHPECYYDAGMQMLEAIDGLVAVWDRQPARGLGGTRHLLSLAEARHLPRLIIPVTGGEAEAVDLDRLADPKHKSRLIFDEIEQSMCEGSSPATGTEETAAELFTRLEACSNKHSAYFRLSLVRSIQWHGIATLVAAVAAVLPQTKLEWKIILATLAALELALVVKAYRRARRLHNQATHERWMQTRFAAELMRAMRHSAGLLDPLHPLIARHQPQWRRFAITAGLLIRRSESASPWERARQHYLDNRLRHPDPKIGQISYFKQKQAEAAPLFHRTHWWGSKLGGTAIVFVIGALLYKLMLITIKLINEHQHLHLYYPAPVDNDHADGLSWLAAFCFSFLPIALPLAAGVFISLRIALDSGRRTYRYQELTERLTTAAATLETLETEASVRRTVTATEEILLDELVEWHLAERQNGAH